MIENEISFYLVKRRGYELEINRMWHPAVICITIQRTLSVAKVRYLIGDKECFKIFYPRFFAWDKSVFIKPYSSLFFAISISIHSNICGNGSCFLNGLFRLHILILSCVLYKSQPSSKKDSPRTSD